MARITQNLFEAIQKVANGEIAENTVDKAHFCATHVEHALLGYGECISEQHAEPDESGNIAWYTVKFPVGTHKIDTNQLRVVEGKSHTHSKKMAEEAIEEKKLDPVGKEDADIDNDGDTDKSDSYLHNRRKAIGKVIRKEDVELDEAKKPQSKDEKDKVVRGVQAAMLKSHGNVIAGRAQLAAARVAAKVKSGMKEDVELDEAKDMSAFDWKSRAKKPESQFSAKKISTGTVYSKKYKEEKDDDDLLSVSRRAVISKAVIGKGEPRSKGKTKMKESITQTIINHNDFVLEITDNPTFKDYFNAVQSFYSEVNESTQQEIVTIATEAYNEGYVDVIFDSIISEGFKDKFAEMVAEGYEIDDVSFSVNEENTLYVEYIATKDDESIRYVHTGTVKEEDEIQTSVDDQGRIKYMKDPKNPSPQKSSVDSKGRLQFKDTDRPNSSSVDDQGRIQYMRDPNNPSPQKSSVDAQGRLQFKDTDRPNQSSVDDQGRLQFKGDTAGPQRSSVDDKGRLQYKGPTAGSQQTTADEKGRIVFRK